MVSDKDCHYMVDLLLLACNHDCEKELGRYVLNNYEQGKRVSIDECRQRFSANNIIQIPHIINEQHLISSYDCLLGGTHG